MSNWQPKDTMPQDGTKFLAWSSDSQLPDIIYWERYDTDVAEEVGEAGYFRYAEDLVAEVAEVEAGKITHWMPLPTRPAD